MRSESATVTVEVREAARALSSTEFCARWPRPFLVSEPETRRRRRPATDCDAFASTEDPEGEVTSIAAIFTLESADGHVVSVGRGPRSDVRIDVRAVSRLHALLREVDGRWFIADASSRNGTRLRGQTLPSGAVREVCDSDAIEFGRVPFRFVLPATLHQILGGRTAAVA